MKKTVKDILIALGVVLALVGLDQLTKYWVIVGLKGKEAIEMIPGVFELCYLENTSAAFSFDPVSLFQKIFKLPYFYENPQAFLMARLIFLSAVTFLIMIFVAYIYLRTPKEKKFLLLDIICIGIVSGAIGNMIDRIVRHYVVDFFYFKLIDFPVFNVADIYVTVCAFALIFLGMFYFKEEDYARVLPHKKREKE